MPLPTTEFVAATVTMVIADGSPADPEPILAWRREYLESPVPDGREGAASSVIGSRR